jgi:hypothetical protein
VPSGPIRARSPRYARQRLTSSWGAHIIRLLDKVWPVLREQHIRTGHNVVIYHGGSGRGLTLDVGVEAFTRQGTELTMARP